MILATTLFWLGLGLLAYTYFGYGLLLRLAARCAKPWSPDPAIRVPALTIIIAAYNEERSIAARIQNLLACDYPPERLEILVASDGSRDATVAEAVRAGGHRVRVLHSPENRGRAAVHNLAAAAASGEILLFTDAETHFAPDFLQALVPWFSDARYGCGAGDYSFATAVGIGQSETHYWKEEKRLRQDEAALGLLGFASGGCFAIRRQLYQPVPLHLDIDDFLPYRVLAQGRKIFYASTAKAYDFAVSDSSGHYRKRVRTALKAMQGLCGSIPDLWRRHRPGMVLVLISHRLLRWLGGYLLALVAAMNVILAWHGDRFYQLVLAGQVLFYAAGAWAWLEERGWLGSFRPHWPAHRLVLGFLLANLAFCRAVFGVVTGERQAGYRPVSQAQE